MYKGREIVFAGRMAFGTAAREALDSIRIGINLTIANIAGNLILGGGRFIIDRYWGIEDFGEVSFSLTLTNFFLLFISQISMVLFPALRQIDEKRQKSLFEMSKHVLNVILPIVFLCIYRLRRCLSYGFRSMRPVLRIWQFYCRCVFLTAR